MLPLWQFRKEVSTKLLLATKTDKPKELQPAFSAYMFCRAGGSIPKLSELLDQVVTEAFSSHADIRQLLTIYADRLRWHGSYRGNKERCVRRLILQTQDTERELANHLTVLQSRLRSSDLKEADRVREATLLVNGFYVHLRLLNILDTLGDQASKLALQKCRKEYQRLVTEYRAERKRRCSVTVSISESRTEVTVQDSGRTFTVQLTKEAPENVDQNELIEMYLKNIICDLDFLEITLEHVDVPS